MPKLTALRQRNSYAGARRRSNFERLVQKAASAPNLRAIPHTAARYIPGEHLSEQTLPNSDGVDPDSLRRTTSNYSGIKPYVPAIIDGTAAVLAGAANMTRFPDAIRTEANRLSSALWLGNVGLSEQDNSNQPTPSKWMRLANSLNGVAAGFANYAAWFPDAHPSRGMTSAVFGGLGAAAGLWDVYRDTSLNGATRVLQGLSYAANLTGSGLSGVSTYRSIREDDESAAWYGAAASAAYLAGAGLSGLATYLAPSYAPGDGSHQSAPSTPLLEMPPRHLPPAADAPLTPAPAIASFPL